MEVYPLVFKPIYEIHPWGGSRLREITSKTPAPASGVGACWDLRDVEKEPSLVAQGPDRGKSLSDLVRVWGKSLLGRASLLHDRFPLQVQWIDAARAAGPWVHPFKEEATSRFSWRPKAWVIVEAPRDGFIHRGFRSGITASTARAAIARGDLESILHRVPVKSGQACFLPEGAVHGVGPGVVLVEISIPGDPPLRLTPSEPAKAGAEVILDGPEEEIARFFSFSSIPPRAEARSHVAGVWTAVTRLITCDRFIVERVRMIEGVEQEIPYAEPVVWIALSGQARIHYHHENRPRELSFGRGDTVLLPAEVKGGRIQTLDACNWLEVTIPAPSDLSEFDRPDRAELLSDMTQADPYVSLNLPGRNS